MSQKIHLSVKDVRAVGQDWRFTVQPEYQTETAAKRSNYVYRNH